MTSLREKSSGYVRNRDLPRLLGLWPEEAAGISGARLAEIVDRLAAAVGAERRRARSRHWTYDLNRHAALIRAHEAEREALDQYERWQRLERLRMCSGKRGPAGHRPAAPA